MPKLYRGLGRGVRSTPDSFQSYRIGTRCLPVVALLYVHSPADRVPIAVSSVPSRSYPLPV